MPGIAGLITNLPRPQAERQLHRMVAVLCHESFYQSGTWIDETLGVYVGWVERKCSSSGGIPVSNEEGDAVVAFSGEEFPEPGTADRLKERGHRLEKGASSYLAHLYEEDASFPANLNGRFHGLVVDRRRGSAMLFNDRYGMHRIYYHEAKEAFYFAAEAKAILAVCPALRQSDSRSLGEFIACGCVLENRTLFAGIQVLPPASAWTFQGNPVAKKASYFQPSEWENQPELSLETYYQTLRDTFARTLPRYFNGGDPIGLSLTGGLDTRMILSWHKSEPGSLPCYSFGGTYRDCQDVVVARKVAKACEQHHEVIPVGQDFLSRFAHYAERAVYLTDACVAVNRSADLYVNEKARAIAPVRMTGNYGGEVLRSVVAFKPEMPAPELFRPEFLSHITAAAGTYTELLRAHPLTFAVFRQAPWHHYGLLALEQTQVALRSPYLDNDFVRTVFRAPKVTLTNNDVSLRLIADGDTALRRIRTDRGYGGNGSGLYSTALQSFIEFTVKAEYAYDYGMPQWVSQVDHAFSPLHLERLFLGRHKFAHFRVWYRDALSDYVRQMLLDSRTLKRPYLNGSAVEAVVHGHLKGGKNYTTEIHQLLTLELLHRLFLDSQ
jgi:asparagine synthase (glutamine-hydrolysing)